ncbi:MAG TPA: hypothetical protein VF490_12400, partial [Chryseosolibacter sp.]
GFSNLLPQPGLTAAGPENGGKKNNWRHLAMAAGILLILLKSRADRQEGELIFCSINLSGKPER